MITGRATYGIALQEVDAAATWAAFRAGVTAFMVANAASGPGAVRAMIRPELWDYMDGILVGDGGYKFEYDRLREALGSANMTSNALPAPAGDPLATTALLTTSTGGIAPVFRGPHGALST